MTPLDISVGMSPVAFEQLVTRLKSGEQEIVVYETTHRRKDGSTYDVEARLQWMHHEKPPVFVVIAQDVTESKKLLRIQEELKVAHRIQDRLMPIGQPRIPGYDIYGKNLPALEVGGDYYDFDVGADGSLTLAIGDATGHGMKAGTMVSVMKSLFWAGAANTDIREFFRKSSTTIKKLKFWNLFMALTIAKIKDDECVISSAGMPPVYYYKASEKEVEKIVLKGPPLGSVPNFSYRQKTIHLRPGDTLLFLTDGLPELFNEQDEMLEYRCIRKMFGEVAHKKPKEIIDHLIDIGDRWKNGAPPEDDITFLVVKAK